MDARAGESMYLYEEVCQFLNPCSCMCISGDKSLKKIIV